jgi:hypothetical protein
VWDQSGNGLFYCENDSTTTYYHPPVHSKSRMRFSLYQHSFKIGGNWQLCHFVQNEFSIILSASSDGTIRGGMAACLAFNKESSLSLLEFYQFIALKNQFVPKNNQITTSSTSTSSSTNNIDGWEETAVLTTMRKLKVENFSSVANEINQHSELAIHSVDHTMVEDSIYDSTTHILAFGGASGVIVIKPFTCLEFPSYN